VGEHDGRPLNLRQQTDLDRAADPTPHHAPMAGQKAAVPFGVPSPVGAS
jgi:hypothetical protein